LVGQNGVIPHFLPRRNVRFKAKGVREWTEMLLALFTNPQEWLEDYHLRSNSEAVFSMLERNNLKPLRKRLDRRRETEDYLRAIVHNIKRLCYLRYLDNEISKRLSKILS
jgi:transposase